ncbi:NF038120 family PEP-CTERM protein [Janthinobacterium sp.]|uniref:NF038120 family PEP-CTERM protein n=1 Tax=Janthinobacterium sp. TaxID=1871054 RepID=UPI00293D5BAD|nr:NF038120 family PEP-CTERM protein [Janthinobacterium sp.]
MNRTAQFFEQHTRRPLLRATIAAALLAGAAAPAARADVIDFEGLANTTLGHDESFRQGNFIFNGVSVDPLARPGDMVGTVVDGGDAGLCVNLACPGNNTSNYFAGLNDGVLVLSAANGANQVRVAGFDASFIGSVAGVAYPSLAGFLRVQGFSAGGGSMYEDYLFPGGANGFSFQHFTASAKFASQQFSEVAFFAFSCGNDGNCSAFTDGKGQFALDNVIASVPEPSSYLMMLLGLAGIGAFARRRRA